MVRRPACKPSSITFSTDRRGDQFNPNIPCTVRMILMVYKTSSPFMFLCQHPVLGKQEMYILMSGLTHICIENKMMSSHSPIRVSSWKVNI